MSIKDISIYELMKLILFYETTMNNI